VFPANNTIELSYVKICDSDKISRFDAGSLILLVCAIIVVAAAAQQVQKFAVLEEEEHTEL
jgi:hypothetical protein